ncbi:hypothetical protein L3X38_000552 [Prunus dulcis]|uniref:HAT C-terminal dimerisation domain-containing protein n=1 Tax=Prunus dulcis TaxID=3755 RepID=A0AAD4ZJ11_PRUDU|nr:hypothetical protein L3X38_000552 [Prunus dulcis]
MKESWIKESQANDTVILKHEIDRYITDSIEKVVFDFDILKWWKLNGVKYLGLALIAKDVLAILVLTVASKSCFNTGGRYEQTIQEMEFYELVESEVEVWYIKATAMDLPLVVFKFLGCVQNFVI